MEILTDAFSRAEFPSATRAISADKISINWERVKVGGAGEFSTPFTDHHEPEGNNENWPSMHALLGTVHAQYNDGIIVGVPEMDSSRTAKNRSLRNIIA